MFSKLFKIKTEPKEEEPKRIAIDSSMLLCQLEMAKEIHARQRASKGSTSYARGSLDAYNNVISMIQEMPKYEVEVSK